MNSTVAQISLDDWKQEDWQIEVAIHYLRKLYGIIRICMMTAIFHEE